MIKTYTLRNLLMYGDISAAQLEAELKKTAPLGALHDILTDGDWAEQCLMSKVSRDILFNSATALEAIFTYRHLKEMIWASQVLLSSLRSASVFSSAIVPKAKVTAVPQVTSYTVYEGKVLLLKVEDPSSYGSFLMNTPGGGLKDSSPARVVFSQYSDMMNGLWTYFPLKLTPDQYMYLPCMTITWLPMDVEGI